MADDPSLFDRRSITDNDLFLITHLSQNSLPYCAFVSVNVQRNSSTFVAHVSENNLRTYEERTSTHFISDLAFLLL